MINKTEMRKKTNNFIKRVYKILNVEYNAKYGSTSCPVYSINKIKQETRSIIIKKIKKLSLKFINDNFNHNTTKEEDKEHFFNITRSIFFDKSNNISALTLLSLFDPNTALSASDSNNDPTESIAGIISNNVSLLENFIKDRYMFDSLKTSAILFLLYCSESSTLNLDFSYRKMLRISNKYIGIPCINFISLLIDKTYDTEEDNKTQEIVIDNFVSVTKKAVNEVINEWVDGQRAYHPFPFDVTYFLRLVSKYKPYKGIEIPENKLSVASTMLPVAVLRLRDDENNTPMSNIGALLTYCTEDIVVTDPSFWFDIEIQNKKNSIISFERMVSLPRNAKRKIFRSDSFWSKITINENNVYKLVESVKKILLPTRGKKEWFKEVEPMIFVSKDINVSKNISNQPDYDKTSYILKDFPGVEYKPEKSFFEVCIENSLLPVVNDSIQYLDWIVQGSHESTYMENMLKKLTDKNFLSIKKSDFILFILDIILNGYINKLLETPFIDSSESMKNRLEEKHMQYLYKNNVSRFRECAYNIMKLLGAISQSYEVKNTVVAPLSIWRENAYSEMMERITLFAENYADPIWEIAFTESFGCDPTTICFVEQIEDGSHKNIRFPFQDKWQKIIASSFDELPDLDFENIYSLNMCLSQQR